MGADQASRYRDFEAELSLDHEGSPAALRLAGSADSNTVGQLQTLIEDLHAKVLAAHTRLLAVDIRELEFMNATCFNVLVWWVGVINELTPGERYVLRFSTNEKIPWQRRSLRTLSCFATDLVVVEAG